MPLEVQDAEVEGVITCGLLALNQKGDREAIAGAVGALLDRFPPGRWPLFVKLSPNPASGSATT